MSLEKLYSMPGHLIRRCQQISVGIYLDECKQFDLKPVDFAVLSALDSFTDIDQITLSGLIAIDRSSIGRVVENLEGKGLISRRADSQDRRTKRLRLTKQGGAQFAQIKSSVDHVQERILKPLSKTQRTQFINCLEKIALHNNEISRVPVRSAPPQK